MSSQALYDAKFHISQNFAATGVIGNSSYDIPGEVRLSVVVEEVGANNIIDVRGRLKDQAAFVSLQGVTGTSTGTTITTNAYDQVQFHCDTYDANGTPKLITSGFYF